MFKMLKVQVTTLPTSMRGPGGVSASNPLVYFWMLMAGFAPK